MESYSYSVSNNSPIVNIISLVLCVIAIAGAWKIFEPDPHPEYL